MADKIFKHKNASGKVTIAVFREQAPTPSAALRTWRFAGSASWAD
ncbi:hypothetical protein [Streptomyces sp. NPDC005408]